MGVHDAVETAILGLINYVRNSKEKFIAANTVEKDDVLEIPNEYKMRKKNERKKQWAQKQLHGQFITQTMRKASKDRCG